MKKSIAVAVIGLAVGLGLSSVAHADDRAWPWSPIGLGLAAPIQLPFMSSDVYGLRFGGFLGYNRSMYGIDVGVVEMAEEDMAGLQAALFTWTDGDAYGVQLGACANVINGRARLLQFGAVNYDRADTKGVQFGLVNRDTEFAGVQFAGIVNWNDTASYGVQFGLVNANQDEFSGASLAGLVNYSKTSTGLQLGLLNVAYEATGFQLGLINACDTMRGVQIGLVNLIAESTLPIMVIANASF